MKKVIGPRASTILYNTIVSNRNKLQDGFMLLPANICPIVPITLLKASIKFSFIDIDKITQCMNVEIIWKELRNRFCKGILFAHSYGNTQATKDLFREIRNIRDDIFLIDDRCNDVPQIREVDQNIFANLNLYSTGYAKFVEFGYGGFGFLSDETVYKAANELYSEKDHNDLVIKMNYNIQNCETFRYEDSNWLKFEHNLDEEFYLNKIAAQIPISKAHKESLNEIYVRNLPDKIQMPKTLCQWRFNLQINNKEEVLKAIFDAGFFASSHYASVSKIFTNKSSPVAEETHSRMINLFNDHRMTVQKATEICEIINKELSQCKKKEYLF